MVVGEIPSGAQPPTGCFTELTQESGAQKLAHLGGFRRQAPTLIGGAFKADGLWGWRTGSGTCTVGPPSAASLKASRFELLSPHVGQRVSAEQGGPLGTRCGHSTAAEHLPSVLSAPARPLLQLPPPDVPPPAVGHSLLAEHLPIHKLQHLYGWCACCRSPFILSSRTGKAPPG